MTTARIEAVDPHPDGRYDLLTFGHRRFRLGEARPAEDVLHRVVALVAGVLDDGL